MVHSVPQCLPTPSLSYPIYVGGPFWVKLPSQTLELKRSCYHFLNFFLCQSAVKSNLCLAKADCTLFRDEVGVPVCWLDYVNVFFSGDGYHLGGMMGRVRTSMEPRVVSSVTNCSPLSTHSFLSVYIAVWGDEQKNKFALKWDATWTTESSQTNMTMVNFEDHWWTRNLKEYATWEVGIRELQKGGQQIKRHTLYQSVKKDACAISTATIKMKSYKSTTCTRISKWDIIKKQIKLFYSRLIELDWY